MSSAQALPGEASLTYKTLNSGQNRPGAGDEYSELLPLEHSSKFTKGTKAIGLGCNVGRRREDLSGFGFHTNKAHVKQTIQLAL